MPMTHDAGAQPILWTGWAVLLIAPFVGSFVATLAVRLPARRPILWARSACPACGAALGPVDLLPIFGWVLRRGHCRACDAAIDPAYPLTEIGALALAAWAALVGFPSATLWAVAGLGWTLLALAAIDARRFLLPDVLTLPLVPAGLAVAYAAPRWPVAPADAAIGAVAGFAALALIGLLYRRLRGREGIGLGDAKLLAAAGAWTGWQGLASVVLVAAATGLAAAVLAALIRRRRLDPLARLPFGVFLALGLWLVVLYGPIAF